MGLFDFFKKSREQEKPSTDPYHEPATNLIYHLLFCDRIELYKEHLEPPLSYPYDVLFSETSVVADLQKVIDDPDSDPRIKLLAYNKQLAAGHIPTKKELLAVIIEVGLEKGLDVLAAFSNGTARYINQTGKLLIWETTDETSNKLTSELFSKSQEIIAKIGPWDKARLPRPARGNARMTFLVSDGLYFGEGPIDVLFNDPMASSALACATQLMKHLTENSG